MADAPDVRLQISAEDQGVAAAVKQLTTQLQSLKTQEQATAESSLSLSSAFESLLGVLAVEKIIGFGKEVFNTTTNILKLSNVTGVSTETLSVYAAAATDAGVSFDEVSAGITKLATIVTQFEQGNQKAAKAIALTGLSLKDLAGLNSEQKIRAITDAIGKMPPGFQKTTAETKLLGDGSGNLNRVMNQLAGDGFQKTREEAEKLGNIVGSQTAIEFEQLRAAIADMQEAAEGMVRQFEAGLVPSLTDIANAILRVTSTDGASGFKSFGEEAGGVLKDLVLLAALLFGGIEKIVQGSVEGTKNLARAAADVLSVGPAQAARNLKANQAASDAFVDGMVDAQLDAVRRELEGTTRLQEEAIEKQKALLAKNKGADRPIANEEAIKGLIKLQAQQDAAYKAGLSAKNKALTAEEEISKASLANREEGERSDFERGLSTLADYFDQRRLEIEAAGKDELAILVEQRANEAAAEARAAAELRTNRSKAKKAGGSETLIGQEFQAAAARNQADVQRAQQAVADLDTKIQVQALANKTKLTAEDLNRFKTEAAQLTKLAEFRKTILDLQGKTADAAKVEADAKEAEYRLLLTSQPGATAESIDAEVQKYRELTTAVGQFNDARVAGETALKIFTDKKAAIEDQVKSGKLFQIQADEQIEALGQSQLSILQAIAKEQLRAATATGNQANIATAKDFQKQVDTIATESNAALTDLAKIKAGIQNSLSGALDNFFSTGITGARSLGQAFAGLADGIVSSLQKMASQMLTNIIMQKLFSSLMAGTTGGAGGGGLLGGLLPNLGFSEGGKVSGPGTGTSDSIPARLSAGEFVIRESAVRAIGPEVLAAMNRGLRAPAYAHGGLIPHFAEGGLVEGSGKGGETARVHLQLGLDEGIVLKHMSSRAGAKVVVQHLANNPKSASKALGRGK
jgi:hypothetical protein